MNSDRTVYAPEMDEGGNGVVRVPTCKNRANSSRSIFCCLLIPFFFSTHLFIHSLPNIHTYTRKCIYKCLPRFKSRADISILRDVLFILEICVRP